MSFDIAVTGISASSTDLEVISNNIANAQTTGFKRGRVGFEDLYASSFLGTFENTVGRGVQVGSIKNEFIQGDIAFTENQLDLAISGRGFFRYSDNGSINFSRDGSLKLDNQGFIVNSAGMNLTGYQADAAGNITGSLGNLFVATNNLAPFATTSIDYGLNFDSQSSPPAVAFPNVVSGDPDPASYNYATSITIFDSLGASHIVDTYYVNTGTNQWQTYTYSDSAQVDGPDDIVFNNNGTLASVNGVVGATTISVPAFNPGSGAADLNITLDYGASTQYGEAFDLNSLNQDGYTTGRLSSLEFGGDGTLFARYTNGESLALGQVVLANFASVSGLNPLGGNNWSETPRSGPPLIGSPGTSSLGNITAGALEESNVDITKSLVDLITAQRSFEANAQVISTTDSIQQTIINIR